MATLTATAEPTNIPPRVELVVDLSDQVPVPDEVTITRSDSGGTVNVREAEPVELSGGIATLYDYELPFGAVVTYEVASPALSDTATITVTDVWLRHVSIPDLSVPVELLAGSYRQRSRPTRRGTFRPLGRRRPIFVTSGARGDEQFDLVVLVADRTAADALGALIDDESALLLGVPSTKGLLIPQSYVSVGDVDLAQLSSIGEDHSVAVTLPCTVVDRPEGGIASQWTLAGLGQAWSTIGDVGDAYDTLLDVGLDRRL